MNKRKIKFRAWNKVWGMMSLVDKIEFEEGKPVSVSVTIKATDFDHTDEWSDYEVGDDIILQQFTGLKDVNGVEIYEGDIILYPDTESEFIDVGIGGEGVKVAETGINSFFPVEFKDGEFGINVNLNSEILYNGWYTLRMALEEVESIEVIGNIYENPELLKV